jgi:hypothetical protein
MRKTIPQLKRNFRKAKRREAILFAAKKHKQHKLALERLHSAKRVLAHAKIENTVRSLSVPAARKAARRAGEIDAYYQQILDRNATQKTIRGSVDASFNAGHSKRVLKLVRQKRKSKPVRVLRARRILR